MSASAPTLWPKSCMVTQWPSCPTCPRIAWFTALRCGAAGKGSPLSTSSTSWSKRTAKNQCPSSGSFCRRWGCFAVTSTYMSPGDVKALLSFSLISPENETAIKLLWVLNKVSLAEDSGIEQKSPNISTIWVIWNIKSQVKYIHELELAGICKVLEGQEGFSQSLSKKK